MSDYFEIQVEGLDGPTSILFQNGGATLLELLQQAKIPIDATCGGKGTCGKCRVRLLSGELAVTPGDERFFSGAELAAGWRLACLAVPAGNCKISLPSPERKGFHVVDSYQRTDSERSYGGTGCGIAIDIGTTTLAMQCFELTSGRLLASHTALNPQRSYGADVISRIKAANEGAGQALRTAVTAVIADGVSTLLKAAEQPLDALNRVVIAGNTTMTHLLLGYPCETLGVFPFTPVNIETVHLPLSALIGSGWPDIPATVLPGVSTYVGGDIASGMLLCDFDRLDGPTLLLDLGTNGEMALGTGTEILCTATAAGPAFEGGGITWGTGSVTGAISHLTIEHGAPGFETIGGGSPIGICGTGVIDTAAALLRAGLVDETGLLEEDYFDDGYPLAKTAEGAEIVFTQRDVREIQLAKAAVRAGVETLLVHAGLTAGDLEKVYLAGGFGLTMDVGKALDIGLLPRELEGRIHPVGNASLGGAVRYLLEPSEAQRMGNVLAVSTEVNLSATAEFNNFYMEHMAFLEFEE